MEASAGTVAATVDARTARERGAGTQRVHAGTRRQVQELGRSKWPEMAHGGEWNGDGSGVALAAGTARLVQTRAAPGAGCAQVWRCAGGAAAADAGLTTAARR
jgi:hypothetical protein